MPKGLAVFLDFEASSLGRKGFPIEVAWVFETGEEEAHLIRPAEGWTEWDASAEAIHRNSRRRGWRTQQPPSAPRPLRSQAPTAMQAWSQDGHQLRDHRHQEVARADTVPGRESLRHSTSRH